jgi:hypothetical protein
MFDTQRTASLVSRISTYASVSRGKYADRATERMAKGAHLGVLVGFAVVTPNFNPIEQNAQTMRTMCE